MTFELPKTEEPAQVRVVSEFAKELRRQIKIEWKDLGWGTGNGYMIYKKYLKPFYMERIGGPFTIKQDAEDYVEEYIADVIAILLETGELKED